MDQAQARVPQRRELSLDFSASGSEYFRIWIVNLLLTLVTLGLYLPFAKARRLRYFYANTQVDGHALAFHGDPWRMFRGHLIVLGAFLAYVVFSQFAPVAGVAIALTFMLLWPALWRASMIFRMRNTSWRGLRFDFNGSLGGAYWVFAPYLGFFLALIVGSALVAWLVPSAGRPQLGGGSTVALVVIGVIGFYLALGLLMAYTWVRLKRYQHGGYRIAQQQGELNLSVGALLMLGLRAMGLTLLGVIVLGVATLVLGLGAGLSGESKATTLVMLPLGFAAYLLFFFAWGPYFSGRLQDLTWNGTRSDGLRFRSRVPARRWGLLMLKNVVLLVLTLGLYWPFAQVAVTRLRLLAVRIGLEGDLASWFGEAQKSNQAVGEMAGDFFGFDVGL